MKSTEKKIRLTADKTIVMTAITVLWLLLCTLSATAQNISIKGIVYDEIETPLAGVHVSVEGTSNGTVTD